MRTFTLGYLCRRTPPLTLEPLEDRRLLALTGLLAGRGSPVELPPSSPEQVVVATLDAPVLSNLPILSGLPAASTPIAAAIDVLDNAASALLAPDLGQLPGIEVLPSLSVAAELDVQLGAVGLAVAPTLDVAVTTESEPVVALGVGAQVGGGEDSAVVLDVTADIGLGENPGGQDADISTGLDLSSDRDEGPTGSTDVTIDITPPPPAGLGDVAAEVEIVVIPSGEVS